MNNKTRITYDVIGVNDGASSASSVDALENESWRRTAQDNIPPPTYDGQSSRHVESITITTTVPPVFSSNQQQSQQQERGEFDRKVTTRGYHADDDSVVSSNHIEDNDLESAGNNITPFPLTVSRSTANNSSSINNNNNNASNQSKTTRISKHQCYIIGIALLILTGGIVLILGYTIFNTDGDSTPFESNSADREINLGGTNDNDDNVGGGGTSTTDDDGVDDDDVFNNGNNGIIDILEPTKPIPGDISSYIAYHVIIQEISELSSFTDLDGPNVSQFGSTISASQKARDFLVFDDTLPVAVADEIGEQRPISVADEIGEAEDEEETTTTLLSRRPYLGANTPAYRIVQRYATVVLYYATNGTEWIMSNLWLESGVHECDWIGITCEDIVIPSFTLEDAINNPTELPHHSGDGVDTITERMVVSIDLPENNVSGYIPQELAGLPYLRRLGLWSNDLTGTLPSELGKVLNLTTLILSDNSLTGSIPKRWSKLINLQRLEIQTNDMNFVVPESICSLTRSDEGGSLEVLVVDCLGADPEVACSCCTRCY
jgi:hypothetical protein